MSNVTFKYSEKEITNYQRRFSIMDKRKIDKLGRVTIPKHLRDEYNMHEGHLVSITGGDNELTIRNYEDTNRCLITGKTEGIKMISGIIHLSNEGDRKSTRLNSSQVDISYAVFCLKKKKTVYSGTKRSVTVINMNQHEKKANRY